MKEVKYVTALASAFPLTFFFTCHIIFFINFNILHVVPQLIDFILLSFRVSRVNMNLLRKKSGERTSENWRGPRDDFRTATFIYLQSQFT